MDPKNIESLSALESTLGKTPAAIALKVIDHLDDGARAWIAQCPLAFVGLSTDEGPVCGIAGDHAGFMVAGEGTLEIPRAALDLDAEVAPGAGFGSVLLLPQAGEMLRINGRVVDCAGDRFRVKVEECYIHCAKALIRSRFWEPQEVSDPTADPIEGAHFAALVTMNEAGEVDVSPKGDPAGALAVEKDGHVWLADRPGNRRADSFKNLLSDPRIAGVFLTPGSASVTSVSGTATPTTDAIRAEFAVKGKVPAIVTRIAIASRRTFESSALQRSEIWTRPKTDIHPAKILAGHVQLNKHLGVGARIAGIVTAVPGVMRKSLDASYEKDLY